MTGRIGVDVRAERSTVDRLEYPSPWWLAATGIAIGLMALAGIGARATYGARTTADEPQYLLTALSLAADGDLDIANQLDDEAYRDFHEIPVDPQTRALDASGRRVSPHDPLLPLVLAAPIAVGGWVAAKATLAALAGLTAVLTLWMAQRRFGADRNAAVVAVLACFAGIPLAAYGTQVYPEIPAALLVAVAVAALAGDTERLVTVGVVLAAIVGLPWLAVKYVPVALVLGVALLVGVRRRRQLLLGVLGFVVAAGAIYVWAHQAIYGGWTVYASGDHFESAGEFAVVGSDMDLPGRSRRLIGLLVDRRFGIAVWSPVWFLLPPAVAAAVQATRRPSPDRRRFRLVVGIVAAGWLTATFVALTMHGWWVPGRQLVVVLPAAAVLVATWASAGQRRLLATGLLGAVGAINWLWLAVESSVDRRTLVVDFAETAAPFYRLMSPVFPDGMAGGWIDDVGLAVWALVLAAPAVALYRMSGWRRSVLRRLPGARVSLHE